MKYQPQCLITGCYFFDENEDRYIKGDLHQLFDILIVNASGLTWQYLGINASERAYRPPDAKDKVVKSEYFYEKGGQIVFPLIAAQFNLAANSFLNTFLASEEGARSVILHAKLKGH